jgi:hypothetical protein
MAAGKKLKASEQVRQKIVALMTGKKLKASEQKLASVDIVGTAWKPVEDPETAIKEANAARLARAMYDQALTSDDPGVVSAMLSDVEDDGTAGAALLKAALQVLQAKSSANHCIPPTKRRRANATLVLRSIAESPTSLA